MPRFSKARNRQRLLAQLGDHDPAPPALVEEQPEEFLVADPVSEEFLQTTKRIRRSDVRKLSRIPGLHLLLELMEQNEQQVKSGATLIASISPPAVCHAGRKQNQKVLRLNLEIRYQTKARKE